VSATAALPLFPLQTVLFPGGRHRSVYLAEKLAAAFAGEWRVLVRHRGLAKE
jgi:RNase adaptor protein for sRNA GlmZ degradation